MTYTVPSYVKPYLSEWGSQAASEVCLLTPTQPPHTVRYCTVPHKAIRHRQTPPPPPRLLAFVLYQDKQQQQQQQIRFEHRSSSS